MRRDTTSSTPARRPRIALSLAAALLTLACLAGLRLPAPAAATAAPLGFNQAYTKGNDWRHLKLALVSLEAAPPRVPAVYLFGGSAAREATVSDRSWSDQLTRLAGRKIRAFNFGTAGQSYDEDMGIVERLPAGNGIVLIGVNLGRYTQRPIADPDKPGWLPAGEPRPVSLAALFNYVQHRFGPYDVGGLTMKRAILTDWLARRYPVFQDRYAYNVRQLDRLIIACQKRDLDPVLVNLPINEQFLGSALSVPCNRFAATSRAARQRNDIHSWDFVDDVGLVNADFVDLWHVVHSGSVKYQQRLSKRTGALLHELGMAP